MDRRIGGNGIWIGPMEGRATAPERRSGCLVSLAVLGVLIGLAMLDGSSAVALWGAVLLLGSGAYLLAPARRRWMARRREHRRLARQPDAQLAASERPAELLREITAGAGGGVFIGLGAEDRAWVTAGPQQAVMVLGPPRSGKTTAVVIPALLSAAGAAVSTSTKLDVLAATAPCRSAGGRIWVFDPSGTEPIPPGAARLRWSPVDRLGSWDDALTTARVMVDAADVGRGGDSEYWNERAGALLAGMLHAAAVSGRSVADVRTWVLRHELDRPIAILETRGEALGADLLEGVARTSERARSGIFSTAASVLSAYNSAAALEHCERPNFDAAAFAASSDTLYITAPAHLQARLAPLVVGLLEQLRGAAYARARQGFPGEGGPPVLWALDEVANIAPLSTLPAIVSEGGGQGLQVLACLQDLSQARARWGPAADGFLSLFGTKVVFAGIGDLETLRALSAFVGTWDRPYTSITRSSSKTYSANDPLLFGASRSYGQSTTTSVRREAILTEGDIANLPAGHALLLQPRHWAFLRTEAYFASPCWENLRSRAPQAIVER